MIYRFGEYSLDEERYQLRWRGDELELEPKVFEVLCYLLRERGRVVPKSELLEQLWPDQIVGEWSLTRCISVARKAVQDSPTNQRVIQTLYGRGYRFVAELSEEPEPDPKTGTSPPALGWAESGGGRTPLIGRERPLAELRAGLEAALAGRGRVFLVTGETGIGKTRLTEELARLAEERGAAVCVGRCREIEGAPAFWPWVQILRSELRSRGAEALRSAMGSSAAEIVQLIPELRDELPDLPEPTPLDPRQARFRLFDAVSRMVKRVSQSRPVVLVLDDLHCADRPSLRLLEFLAREIGSAAVLIVGTYREDELERDRPRQRIVADLARASAARYVPLVGLEQEDVARFVRATTGEEPEDRVLFALHQQTGGNPFFLTRVVPALAEEGRLGSCELDQPLDLVLPQGVRQAILRQLDGLSPRARRVLELAAVLGRRFSFAVLGAALELDGEALRGALGELMRTGLAFEDGDRPGHFRFAHALVRDTLYSELDPSERAAWHQSAGEALERVHGGDDSAHLTELAHHFGEARFAGSEKKALDYAIAAGRWASEGLAYEEASRYYERALELIELPDFVDEARRCDLLIELGAAQLRAGDLGASGTTLQRAAELARGMRAPERLARAAVAMAQSFQPFARGIVDEKLVGLLEAALVRLPERDSALRARTMMSLGVALYWADDRYQRCASLCEDALEMARRIDDPETVLATISAVISVRWGPDLVEERAQLATEAIQLGETAGAREELIDARLMRLIAWFELGRMEAVDQELAEISQLATDLQQSEIDEYTPLFRATRAIMSGDFEVGEKLAGEFLEDAQKRGDEKGLLVFALQFLGLRWTQGRGDEIVELVESLCDRHVAVPMYRAALARIYCDCGRTDDAQRALERLLPGDAPRLTKKLGWFPTMALLAESAALLGDRRRCEILYRALAPYSRRHVTAGSASYMGSASRYLGLLATALERWDMAERHFGVALEMESHVGARPLVAWTRYYHARMLYREERDPARAGQIAGLALETARDLGLSALCEQILALAP